jgi:hypothetical protein
MQGREWSPLREVLARVSNGLLEHVIKDPICPHLAWSALQKLIAKGQVRACGARLERRPSGWWDEGEEGLIPPDAVGALSLVPRESGALWLGRLEGSDGRPSSFWLGIGIFEADFFRWQSESARVTRRHGRPPGAGSFARLDAPLLQEMERLIDAGDAASAESAAKLVATKAHGAGSYASKVDRLARQFRKQHPDYIARLKSV